MKKLTIQIEIHNTAPNLTYKVFRDAFQFTLDGCRDKINTGDYGLDGKTITPEGVTYKWKIIPPENPKTIEDILT